MNHTHISTWVVLLLGFTGADIRSQDSIRPLRVVRVTTSESQVVESSDSDQVSWILLHQNGLRVVDLETGAERDIWKAQEGIINGQTGRWLTSDGKFFGFISKNRTVITVARVADGQPLARLDSTTLMQRANWSVDSFLAEDASYILTLNHNGDRNSVVRLEFAPSPHVAAAHELGPFACNMSVAPNPSGVVVVVDSDDREKAGSNRSIRVFDHRLRLRHEEKIKGPMFPLAVTQQPFPWMAIRSAAGDPGMRIRGEPSWAVGKLVGQPTEAESKEKLALSTRFGAKHWVMAAAFSPDAKWLVTSRVDRRTILGIWSTESRALIRELHVEGGRHDMLSHQVIRRLDFSKSGRYLCASDYSNAYLLDFSKLVESPNRSSPE